MKFPTSVSELPDEAFYAIIEQKSVLIPDAGHGYPEHTENHWSIQTFSTRDGWVSEVERRAGLVFGNKNWKAVKIIPASTVVDIRVVEGRDA